MMRMDDSETKFSACVIVPGNTAVLDDGSGTELDDAHDYVWDVDIDGGGYSMPKLLEELSKETTSGGWQEPLVWFRSKDKKQAHKKSHAAADAKESQAAVSHSHSVPPEGNVYPALMDDEGVFMDDEAVCAAFGLKTEADAHEADRKSQSEEHHVEPIFCADNAVAQIPVDDNADVENDLYPKENPRIKVNEYFPTMEDFRMALRQHGIKKGFQVHKVKTDKTRYRAQCNAQGCPWRIVAHKLRDQPTVVITMIPEEHNCLSTSKLVKSMASQKWVAERVVGWLRQNPALGAKELQDKLQEVYSVEVGYGTVWAGRQKAMNKIFQYWDDSFHALYNFRADLLSRSPGSVVEISTEICGDNVHFDKLFMALQPCIDGFKNGCRPYLGIDSMALDGMYSGQLACACALDGHNWMYPVAWAIFDSESNDNWDWFMGQLKKAIENLPALAISIDGCKGYGNNNPPESFSEWIMNIENMPLVDLVDRLSSMTIELWYKRRCIGDKLSGIILPAIIQQFNAKIRHLGDIKVCKSGLQTAEVFGNFEDMTLWRHVVDLNKHTCNCGEWQLTGKPCLHALALISTEIHVDMESFVHDHYSVERFRAAYSGIIPPMPDKSQWPRVDTGFKLLPPLTRGSRRRRNMIKASHEPGASKQHQSKQCGEFGYCEKGCTLHSPKKRKRYQAEEDRKAEAGAS
uniref:SWIM-type domain-containing protein n=1 Tax=Arundo donax TaxID=35708 RepID=A0A0A9DTF7_ARUDO